MLTVCSIGCYAKAVNTNDVEESESDIAPEILFYASDPPAAPPPKFPQ